MSTAHFRITPHVVPASHIRQYYRATVNPTDELKIAVKQYTPLDNDDPQPGDITIIAAHANGVHKELYEPLFDDLWEANKRTSKFRIRSIWMTDVAQEGESGVLNEAVLGNEPSWFDHARDLLNLVNHFRTQMIPPLFGLGHSFGGNHITNLALMHPRLLDGVLLIDPVILDKGSGLVTYLSTLRRDIWPSREEAAQILQKSPFYAGWDKRVFQRYIEYGLRDLPTPLYRESPIAPSPAKSQAIQTPTPVTLKTTKHQEVFTFMRANYPPGSPYTKTLASTLKDNPRPRRTHPDVPPTLRGAPIYRPEGAITLYNLPALRPRVLYVFASESDLSSPRTMAEKMDQTGTGTSGSGGKDFEGAVSQVLMQGAGHFVPFERPTEVAGHLVDWLDREVARARENSETERREWEEVMSRDGGRGRYTIGEELKSWIMGYMEDTEMVPKKKRKDGREMKGGGKTKL